MNQLQVEHGTGYQDHSDANSVTYFTIDQLATLLLTCQQEFCENSRMHILRQKQHLCRNLMLLN